MRKVFNDTTLRAALDPYSKYLHLFDQARKRRFWMKMNGFEVEINRNSPVSRLESGLSTCKITLFVVQVKDFYDAESGGRSQTSYQSIEDLIYAAP